MSEIIGFPPPEDSKPIPAEEVNPNGEEDEPLSPAAMFLYESAMLIDGDRHKQHGNRHENLLNIATLWSAFLGREITPGDVCLLMALSKISRTKTGTFNPDDYRDAAGYMGLAGELDLPSE